MTNEAGIVSPIPAVEELKHLPEILTAAGIARMFGRAKNTVTMAILTGKLSAYRDGRIVLVSVIDAVKLWGYPESVKPDEVRT